MVTTLKIKSFTADEIGRFITMLTRNGYKVKFSKGDRLHMTIQISKNDTGDGDGQDIPVADGRDGERPADR